MTAKQQIMTEPFKTYVTCIMAFSLPLTSVKLSQFYSITFFVLFTKNNKLRIKEKKIFVYMAASAYHVISKEVENHVFRHNHIFRYTCMYKQSANLRALRALLFIDMHLRAFFCHQ